MFALITHSQAYASDAVKCVQSQLNESGYDVGKPDGVVGNKTKRALKKYQSKNSALSNSSISNKNAIIFCRLIGKQNKKLKKHWPASKRDIRYIFGSSIETRFQKQIKAYTKSINKKFERKFGVELVTPINILVANNERELVDLTTRTVGRAYKNLDLHAKEMCNFPNNVGGRAYPGIILICRKENAIVGSQINKSFLKFLIAHEYFHQVQFQLSGSYFGPYGGKSATEHYGPIWLIEGAANTIANAISGNTSHSSYHHYLKGKREYKNVDLRIVENIKSLKTNNDLAYEAGTIAALSLAIDHGNSSLVQFFTKLGLSKKWRPAFKNTFGTSAKKFYAEFKATSR